MIRQHRLILFFVLGGYESEICKVKTHHCEEEGCETKSDTDDHGWFRGGRHCFVLGAEGG